ncbi:MAG TPA: hypothetical protein VLA69_05425, partial [Gaiellaceae bacterium]|nr:hypothetical protein [Gaiellaceae bacterium]
MHFALFVEAPADSSPPRVTFRVRQRTETSEELVFEEGVELNPLAAPIWRDRTALLSPVSEDQAIELVLETAVTPESAIPARSVAWGNPYLRCERPVTASPRP